MNILLRGSFDVSTWDFQVQVYLIPKFLADMGCLKESDMDYNLFGQDHFYMSEKKVDIDSGENKAITKSYT